MAVVYVRTHFRWNELKVAVAGKVELIALVAAEIGSQEVTSWALQRSQMGL